MVTACYVADVEGPEEVRYLDMKPTIELVVKTSGVSLVA
jgi:hypothetical protein